jgi:uncharacterized cupin superfamily protein
VVVWSMASWMPSIVPPDKDETVNLVAGRWLPMPRSRETSARLETVDLALHRQQFRCQWEIKSASSFAGIPQFEKFALKD